MQIKVYDQVFWFILIVMIRRKTNLQSQTTKVIENL